MRGCIISKDKCWKVNRPIGFLFLWQKSLGRPNMVQLKRSHWAFPRGLYRHVNDWLTPYILHSALMMSLSKHFPWSLCIWAGIPYTWNHLSMSTLATVSAFWFGVTTAMLNLEKVSVITNTFSLPVTSQLKYRDKCCIVWKEEIIFQDTWLHKRHTKEGTPLCEEICHKVLSGFHLDTVKSNYHHSVS